MSREGREWLAIALLAVIEVCLGITAWIVPLASLSWWLVIAAIVLLVPFQHILMTGPKR